MVSKQHLYHIVFFSDTKAGKLFDIILLWSILISILVAMLDSLPDVHQSLKTTFYILEWFFTILFTIEYLLRIYVSSKQRSYILSFWGIIDLIAILPTYVSLFFYGYQYLLIVRVVRLLRVFRVLRLAQFNTEAMSLLLSLKASFHKIGIFLSAVLALVIILGTIMYVVEGGENGFTSIPQSIYWAIITITTVGYGDIVPQTVLGKLISSVTMILGYAIIAVPTGIITVEMARANERDKKCPTCKTKNITKAKYCNNCGTKLKSQEAGFPPPDPKTL